jgi:hypothetical protein
MSKLVRVVAIGVVTVAATIAAVGLGPTAGGQPGPIELEFRVDDISSVFLDFNENGRIDQGDRFVARGPLRDPATGDRVGRAFSECTAMTRISESGIFVCAYTLRLSEGHIILEGRDPAGVGPNVLAVTGGTGLYRDARGQADQMDLPDRSSYTIHLEP